MSCTYFYNGKTYSNLSELESEFQKKVLPLDGELISFEYNTTDKFLNLYKGFDNNPRVINRVFDMMMQGISSRLEINDKLEVGEELKKSRAEILNNFWNRISIDIDNVLNEYLSNKFKTKEGYDFDDTRSIEDVINGYEIPEVEKPIIKKAIESISNINTFKELVEYFYPTANVKRNRNNLSFSDLDTSFIDTFFEETEEVDTNKNNTWQDQGDKINPSARQSAAVKDFIYSIVLKDKDGNIKGTVNPKKAFAILLNGMSNIYPNMTDITANNSTPDMIEHIRKSFQRIGKIDQGYNTEVSAVYNYLDRLHSISVTEIFNKEVKDNFYLEYEGDNRKGYYVLIDKKRLAKIPIRGLDSSAYEVAVENYINSNTDLKWDDIKSDFFKLYNQREAQDIFNSIYTIVNSLRQKSVHSLKYKTSFESEGNGYNIFKDFFYYSFKEGNLVMYNLDTLALAFQNNLKKFADLAVEKTDKGDVLKTGFSLEDLEKAMEILDLPLREANEYKKVENKRRIKLTDLTGDDKIIKDKLKNLILAAYNMHKGIGATYTDEATQEVINDDFLKVNQNYLMEFIEHFPDSKISDNSTYRAGDKTMRWKYTLHSTATRNLEPIFDGLEAMRSDLLKGGHRVNPFIPSGHTDRLRKKIFKIVDHDSNVQVTDRTGEFSVPYSKESDVNFYERRVLGGMLYLLKKNNRIAIQTYTPADAPEVYSYEVQPIYAREMGDILDTVFFSRAKWIKMAKGLENTPVELNMNKHLFALAGVEELKGFNPQDINEALYKIVEEEVESDKQSDNTNMALKAFQKSLLADETLLAYRDALTSYLLRAFEEGLNDFVETRPGLPGDDMINHFNKIYGKFIQIKETESDDKSIPEAKKENIRKFNKEKDKELASHNRLMQGIDEEFKEAKETIDRLRKAGKLKNLQKEGRFASKEEEEDYKKIVRPIYKFLYLNNYFGGMFINEALYGPSELFKNSYAQIKRMGSITGIGQQGKIEDSKDYKNGTRNTFGMMVYEDLKMGIDENTPFFSLFKNLLGKSADTSDGQSFILPYRLKNIKDGFSRYANIGETIKNLFVGKTKYGTTGLIKTSSRTLSDSMVRQDKVRREVRKFMEFGGLSTLSETLKSEIDAEIPVGTEGFFDKKRTQFLAEQLNTALSNKIVKGIAEKAIGEDSVLVKDTVGTQNIQSLAHEVYDLLFDPKYNLEDKEKAVLDIVYNMFLDYVYDKELLVEEFVAKSASKEFAVKSTVKIKVDDKNNVSFEYTNEGDFSKAKVDLRSQDYMIQLNPRKDVRSNTKTTKANQILGELMNIEDGSFDIVKDIYNKLAEIIKLGIVKTNLKFFHTPKGVVSDNERSNFLFSLAQQLDEVPGQEIFASQLRELNNVPQAALNLNTVVNKAEETLFNTFKKNGVGFKAPGGGMVLETADFLEKSKTPSIVVELNNGETIRVSHEKDVNKVKREDIKTWYAEVHIPRAMLDLYHKGLFEGLTDKQIIEKMEEMGINYLGYRIPSTGLSSSLPLKIAGFTYSDTGDNVIVAPREIVLLHGSDFDIDKLYIIGTYVASKEMTFKYMQGASKVESITFYKGLPIGYEIVEGEIKERKVPEGFENFDDYFVSTLAPTIKEFMVKDFDNKTQVNKRKTVEQFIDLMQSIMYNQVQRHLMGLTRDQKNLEEMMTPISFTDIKALTPTKEWIALMDEYSKIFNSTKEEDVERKKEIIERTNKISSVYFEIINIRLRNAKRTADTFYEFYQRNKEKGDLETISKMWYNEVAVQYLEVPRDMNAMQHQRLFYRDNILALDLVGVFASGRRAANAMIMASSNIKEGKKIMPELENNNMFYWFGNPITGFTDTITNKGYSVTNQTNMLTNSALDHQSELALDKLMIDGANANDANILTNFGASLTEITLINGQPIFSEYKKEFQKNRKGAFDYVIEKYIKKLLREDDIEIENEEEKEKSKARIKNYIIELKSVISLIKRSEQNYLKDPKSISKIEEKLKKDVRIEKYFRNILNRVDIEKSFEKSFDELSQEELEHQVMMMVYYKNVVLNTSNTMFQVGQLSKATSSLDNRGYKLYSILNIYNIFADDIKNKNLISEILKVAPGVKKSFRSVTGFKNLDITQVPHIAAAMENIKSILNTGDKIFYKDNKRLLHYFINNFIDIFKDQIELGLANTEEISEADEETGYQEIRVSNEDREKIREAITKFFEENKVETDQTKEEFFPYEELEDGVFNMKGLEDLEIPYVEIFQSLNEKIMYQNTFELAQNLIMNLYNYMISSVLITDSFLEIDLNVLYENVKYKSQLVTKTVEHERVRVSELTPMSASDSWINSFLHEGSDIFITYTETAEDSNVFDSKVLKVRVRPLVELYTEAKEQQLAEHAALLKLVPSTSGDSISFGVGNSMTPVDVLLLKENFLELSNVPIYQIEENGEVINLTLTQLADMVQMEVPRMNHLQANLVKYALLKENFAYSYRHISQYLPTQFLKSVIVSQQLNMDRITIDGNPIANTKKAGVSVPIENLSRSFIIKFLATEKELIKKKQNSGIVMHDKKVKSGKEVITRDVSKNENGVKTVSEVKGEVYYDLKIEAPIDSSNTIISFWNQVYVLVDQKIVPREGKKDKTPSTFYYQLVGHIKDINYYNDLNQAYIGKESNTLSFERKTSFNPSIGRAKITVEPIEKDGKLEVEIEEGEFNKYGGYKAGDKLFIYHSNDILGEGGQVFEIVNVKQEPVKREVQEVEKFKKKKTEEDKSVTKEVTSKVVTVKKIDNSNNKLQSYFNNKKEIEAPKVSYATFKSIASDSFGLIKEASSLLDKSKFEAALRIDYTKFLKRLNDRTGNKTLKGEVKAYFNSEEGQNSMGFYYKNLKLQEIEEGAKLIIGDEIRSKIEIAEEGVEYNKNDVFVMLNNVAFNGPKNAENVIEIPMMHDGVHLSLEELVGAEMELEFFNLPAKINSAFSSLQNPKVIFVHRKSPFSSKIGEGEIALPKQEADFLKGQLKKLGIIYKKSQFQVSRWFDEDGVLKQNDIDITGELIDMLKNSRTSSGKTAYIEVNEETNPKVKDSLIKCKLV